jgi:hypothetical protein
MLIRVLVYQFKSLSERNAIFTIDPSPADIREKNETTIIENGTKPTQNNHTQSH